MTRKQEKYVVNVEQNVAEMATGKPWSLWTMCLVCLLACLIASATAVLVLRFGQFGKPTSNTTIIVHADGKSSQDPGVSTSTRCHDPLTTSGPQITTPSTPTTIRSTSTSVPVTSVRTTISTTTTATVHEVELDEDYEEP